MWTTNLADGAHLDAACEDAAPQADEAVLERCAF